MELNIATLSDFVRNAQILFLKAADTVMTPARDSGLFRMDPIPNHTGNTKEYSEIDLEEYAEIKLEGDQASRARVQQGYNKIGTLYRVAKDIGITWEMRQYNKYVDVIARLSNLGKLPMNRMELDLQHRFTFMTATSYTTREGVSMDISVGDGLALASTAHTVKGSSTTFRNRLANNPIFSRGSLEGMAQMTKENAINQFGEKITIPYDVIWTTDDENTINTVREYLRSTASPDALNAGVVNVYQGRYKHVVLHKVATNNLGQVDSTKAKYWGLGSTENSQAFLAVNQEPSLKATSANGSNEEFSTEDWNMGATATYFIVIPGARFITLSTGDGTA